MTNSQSVEQDGIVVVQWQDPTFLTKLVWSVNNNFFAFFNSS